MVRKSLFKKVTFEQGPEKGLDLIALIHGEMHSRQRATQRPWDRQTEFEGSEQQRGGQGAWSRAKATVGRRVMLADQ